ncbi:hypothetical protein PR202_gb16768 [Eleusine coracana subsp. coracana]|uniref:Uncharacterized protein n=1 Tax=Eleusine coracana subsp. coracana TaxID=191504 RepID=A0AAV5F2P3_ELECO|nr:hypothetical protein PR202_gb16711 [Eleusine coracana subsp. coracana]GJN28620.1 hypothetical protein PR202_gb16768 [Eleusine coracana subsp. coracana]
MITNVEHVHVIRTFSGNIDRSSVSVVAAHGDSVLIQVVLDVQEQRLQQITDYFAYNAGDAAGNPTRPPSLLLLPPVNNNLFRQATGLLHRDEDELVVAELRIVEASKGQMPASKMAELFILRSGKLSVIQPPISVDDIGEATLMSLWQTREVFPIDDRLLCWVNMSHHGGIIFSDVFDESLVLRYVMFPEEAEKPISGPDPYQKVCIAPGGTVKFVNILPPLLLRRRGCHPLPAFSRSIRHHHLDA